jgi:hypothetical protein
MSAERVRAVLVDQRGMAVPLALIVLILLTSLTVAFLAMSSTEPLIAANLRGGEQALALAEGGIERAIWGLANSGVAAGLANPLPAPIPAPYNGQQLVALGGTGHAYTITVAAGVGLTDRTLTARGYVVRNGVTVPSQFADLADSDIATRRTLQLKVTAVKVGGPPIDQKLPGALTVAGTVTLSGNSLADGNDQAAGTPNTCAAKAGITIREKTRIPDNDPSCTTPPCYITNSISVPGSGSTVGTPAQQTISGDQYASDFQQYLMTDAQLAALKSLAQSLNGQGATYVKPTSNAEFNLTLTDGLTFVDTVNGQDLGNPPDGSKLARVKITGGNNSGWLIVMGNIVIDGDLTYNGFVYAHNDFSYRGTGTGGIYGGVLSANAVDAVATVVDTADTGNAKIYYDCTKVANGGSAFSSDTLDKLNNSVVTVVSGTWKECDPTTCP